MTSCKDVVEIVTDYLEGRMGLVDRLRFQLHLGLCTHCRAYVRQMHTTIVALGYLPDGPMPPEVHPDLRKRFANWRPTRSTKSGHPV